MPYENFSLLLYHPNSSVTIVYFEKSKIVL